MFSLNIPVQKLFQRFRRPQLWATGDWQLHGDTSPPMHHISCSFLVKHQITQVTHPPYSPDLALCNFWLFPKLKSPLKGKKFQTISEIQENTMGQLSSSKNISIFHSTWLDAFWTDLVHIFNICIICYT